ncbi:GDSL-type esterase/lipase family protein [Facilibium subflavum]|uniref:GDSL-type esterase/lipase family protein n=1 Tax=Facilibium subflavum TaxID=2219058 RepID=UPI000E65080C|nr:GDSL-type esterase/lipase family protein [Facilibium subflavum]
MKHATGRYISILMLLSIGHLTTAKTNNNDSRITYLGRTLPGQSHVLSNWSGTGISFKVMPKSDDASVQLTLTPIDKGGKTDSWFQVFIHQKDGKQLDYSPILHITKDQPRTLTLQLSKAHGFEMEKTYHIQITQLNEADHKGDTYYNPTAINNITAKSVTFIAPTKPMRKIVFYGDSITTGLQDNNNDNGHTDNDGYANIKISYAFIAIKQLEFNAKYRINPSFIALSGIGFFDNNWWNSSIFDYFDHINYGTGSAYVGKVGQGAENADIVVINLGTNDKAWGYPAHQYQTKLDAFIDRIKQLNPNAKIVLDLWGFVSNSYGFNYSDYWQAISNIVSSQNNSDYQKVCAYISDTTNSMSYNSKMISCLVDKRGNTDRIDNMGYGHPTLAYAKRHAKTLATYLEKLLNATPTPPIPPIKQTLYMCPDQLVIGNYITNGDNIPYAGWGAFLGQHGNLNQSIHCSQSYHNGVQTCIESDPNYPKLLCHHEATKTYLQAAGYLNTACTLTQYGIGGENCMLSNSK